MTPEIIIALALQLFKAGFEIKKIIDTDKPETEEEYLARLKKLLDVPTVEVLEGA